MLNKDIEISNSTMFFLAKNTLRVISEAKVFNDNGNKVIMAEYADLAKGVLSVINSKEDKKIEKIRDELDRLPGDDIDDDE